LPSDVIVARNCRLRRAADLDMKHDHLHGELLAKQTPGESYLQVGFSLSGTNDCGIIFDGYYDHCSGDAGGGQEGEAGEGVAGFATCLHSHLLLISQAYRRYVLGSKSVNMPGI